MHKSIVLLGAIALVLLFGAPKASAQEETIPQDKIPKVVMDALLAKFPKARIDTCVKAMEGGEVVYDIEFRQEGRKCEADIRADGTYINYEQAIEAEALPKAVLAVIEKKYPKSVLKEIMQETEVSEKTERLSAYEVIIETAGKKDVEVRVSPEGKILEESRGK